MAERKLFGQSLSYEERIFLAQLTTQPGWQILVKLMAEACRDATEEVIRLSPTVERYSEVLTALQTTARAMNKFSNEVLGSIKVHTDVAIRQAQAIENPQEVERNTRFKGFVPPQPQSPEGEKQ